MTEPRVLVLEDDASVRTLLLRALQQYGYRTLSAATLDEAAVALEGGDIQALVLDVRLGGTASGLDFLRTLRTRDDFSRTPIIVVTGGVLSESEEALVTRHRAFLFYKPEGYQALVRFLDTLTGRDSGD